jgi:glycosyltransferase involved in cell wall biosynthesis
MAAAMITVPLTICAKNEASSIRVCLTSLLESVRFAEVRHGLRIDPLVVLDDCTDETEAIVASLGVATRLSRGGKVEAQRAGLRPGPFQLFADADIAVEPQTLAALCVRMKTEPDLWIAMPRKLPLPPRRQTLLAQALYRYNATRGYSSQRRWFNGKLFAIRRWAVPNAAEVHARARTLAPDRLLELDRQMRVDDIFLSRAAAKAFGDKAFAEVEEGRIYFRAPETFAGMYAYYRRMRLEMERCDRLFPETARVGGADGHRNKDLLRPADWGWLGIFNLALILCRLRFTCLRIGTRYFARSPGPMWPAIEETKL